MPRIDGVLFDLGVSSHQLDDADRGFSLLRGGPLDMRMDPRLSVTAADLINGLGKKELIRLFETLGEEPYAKKIASRIVEQRQKEPFTRTTQLSSLIAHVVGRRNEGIHPATRVFQAIRMAVNSEREALAHGLSCAVSLLGPGGRIVVISFHSIEDRIVKQQFQNAEHEGKARIVGKLITPNDDEVLENRRSRSAKMRILEKL
jgi:16S rRNA (cytosine1402-N4)-methyltransferase